LGGDAIHERGMEIPVGKAPRPAGGDAEQVLGAALVSEEEGLEDGRHQERPPIMGLEKTLVLARIRLHGGGAERLAAAGGVAELAGQLGERRALAEEV